MSLRVIGADGSGERVLREENGPFFLGSPAWSPDGTRIAFARSPFTGANVVPELYVARNDGSRPQLIAKWAAQPAWSPDGKRLAFTSGADHYGQTCFHDCSPSGEIYVADPDGTHARRLTKSKADDQSPAWSSDGSEIVFASDRSNQDNHELELYLLPANGGEPRRITRNDVWDLEPDWLETSVGHGWSMPDESSRKPEFEAWRGFRTRSGGIHCFETGNHGWTGFMCFRATDGFFVRMTGRDLSTDDPVRVDTGTDPRLDGYENAEVTEVEPGDDWASSDAHMVDCSVRRAAVSCRHASGPGFYLDLASHKTF
jgi:Tol biopolymer transport system component